MNSQCSQDLDKDKYDFQEETEYQRPFQWLTLHHNFYWISVYREMKSVPRLMMILPTQNTLQNRNNQQAELVAAHWNAEALGW